MAESAPEGLRARAEEMGIDLEAALSDLSTRINDHKIRFHGTGFNNVEG
ncbi:MAG: hypothetical protein AB1847_10300 [bacterium]